MPRSIVLVVDDEQVIREAFVELLSDKYDAREASSLEAARAVLAEAPVEVIVLDWMLEDGTTSESLLRELATTAEGPSVILASVSKGSVEVGVRYGIPVLYKPFDLDVLLEAVETARKRPSRPIHA